MVAFLQSYDVLMATKLYHTCHQYICSIN